MKEASKKKGPNNREKKTPAKPEKRDQKLLEKNNGRNLGTKEIDAKVPSDIPKNKAVSDSNFGTETSEVYEDMVVDYVDDTDRSEETVPDVKANQSDDNQNTEKLANNSSDMDTGGESDPEAINDSVSSQGDSQTADEDKPDKGNKAPKNLAKKNSADVYSGSNLESGSKNKNVPIKASKGTQKKVAKSEKGPAKLTTKNSSDSLKNMKVHPKPASDSSEGADDNSIEHDKETGIVNEPSYGARSVSSDDGVNITENDLHEDEAEQDKKIEEMETKIKNLEYELREVAGLEIALYSLVPEHTSSAHKVHTPARRLSRLYIYACKHWSPDRRASVARNSVSGLVLVAKSCGNDVSRLTFWWSNTVVLREIISQTFGSSCQSNSLSKVFDSKGGGKKTATNSSPVKWKTVSGSRQLNKQGLLQFLDDWQETRTFTTALEKVESWIFSRIVESIWWQTLTPSMQSPAGDSTKSKSTERVLGPALGDRRQGSFSINHWENAFLDALKRLCPIRAGDNECGCLPVLARKVMEQCIGRLDVAMFNAILRESAHEIPTDPVSDPIVDSKVLPIPAGDLSFGSGAQLKNAIGHWTRWLGDFLAMDADGTTKEGKTRRDDDDKISEDQKCFPLLNALSDLLMLPKDMLIDKSIRMEVCPSISLPLVKRILCNFTPDEFCPDPVPGTVLEAINAECIIERSVSGESSSSFPYAAAPIMYVTPSSDEVAEKVSEAGKQLQLSRNASTVQRKGYTSDEELDEVESCLTSIINKLPSSPMAVRNEIRNGDHGEVGRDGSIARYDLLREVWQATE